MPGLRLTQAQAQRLWDLDAKTSRAVLATLTERGFLKRTAAGTLCSSVGLALPGSENGECDDQTEARLRSRLPD
jgi:hypothetical protein